ncbi:MAG: metal-dependent hydrolase [Acutalibacteraceae bacterium]|nr:metal-dependent hydrolase [Acutalibacteraceae bacterium]
MTGTTHYIGGVLAGVALVACATPDLTSVKGVATATAMVLVSSISSILPDIDHENSKASKKFKILSLVYKLVSRIGKAFNSDVFEHRGIMHTLIVPIILLFISFVVTNHFADCLIVAGMFGYLSHIVLDALNPTGVPVLSPFYNKKIRLLPKGICVKTSSTPELLVKVALVFGIIFTAKPIASMFGAGLSGNLASIAEKIPFFG